MSGWEEVKRLAADFQRAQLSSTIQRLSERNCIDIIQKLTEFKLIDVIYTTDGKEYLTPQELTKEIREELIVRKGRINLVELQQTINVDFHHIEAKANELVKNDRNLTLVLGQLIDRSYRDHLAGEINDRLQEQGQVTMVELTKAFDLPAEFLSEVIQENLGTVIKGQVDDFDRDVIFTNTFLARHKAKIRGAFSAITVPAHILNIMNQCGLQERLFYTILEELVASGRLAGSVSGGRQDKALYVPDIYTKSQNDWVDSFFKQNGYLEYDALVRLGISDPKGFIKKRLKNESLMYLGTCCASKTILDQIEAEVDEALSSGGWVDIMPILPSVFSASDANQMLQNVLRKRSGAHVFCDTIVGSEEFISKCSKYFNNDMAVKAEKDAKTHPALLAQAGKIKVSGLDDGSSARDNKREERRKKAAGSAKSGGGTQGREGKTKSTKKKYRAGRDKDEDSDDDSMPTAKSRQDQLEIEFMSVEDIDAVLQGKLQDCSQEFVTEIAEKLYRPLRKQYQEVAKSIFLQTAGTASSTARKKVHGELQDKIVGLWTNVKLFEKGIKFFNDDTQLHLNKHLLKTVCTDIANLALNAVATEKLVSVGENTVLTSEVRVKVLSQLPDGVSKSILTKLHTSLNGKSLEEFCQHLETICGPDHLEIVLRKPDKKKERQIVFNHRQGLADQLRTEMEPAMMLHLAATILFQIHTQCMVHAPGRCVPQLIAFLSDYLNKEQHELLVNYQDLVVQHLKKQNEAATSPEAAADATSISIQLEELLPKVKEVALTAKKGAAHNQDE